MVAMRNTWPALGTSSSAIPGTRCARKCGLRPWHNLAEQWQLRLTRVFGRYGAEESIVFAVGAGGEVEHIGARFGAAAKRQRPQPVNYQGSTGITESADELSVQRVCVDRSVSEIADQDVAAELSKTEGGQRDPPRRIECSRDRKSSHQVAVRIEHLDFAETRARNVVMLLRILQRIGDKEIAADILNAKRREAGQ